MNLLGGNYFYIILCLIYIISIIFFAIAPIKMIEVQLLKKNSNSKILIDNGKLFNEVNSDENKISTNLIIK